MQPIEKISEVVGYALSQPAMDELGHFILTKKKNKAIELLADEMGDRLSSAEQALYIESCIKRLAGGKMVLNPVDLSTLKPDVYGQDKPASRYLVRVGIKLFVANYWQTKGETRGYFSDSHAWDFTKEEVDEAYEIVLPEG